MPPVVPPGPGYDLYCLVVANALSGLPLICSPRSLKIPGGATAYRGYSNVQFGSPDKAQCAASGKIPASDWTTTDSQRYEIKAFLKLKQPQTDNSIYSAFPEPRFSIR